MTEHTDFLQICKERGYFHQCTDEEGLRSLLKQGEKAVAYIGFDATAPSLHVGSLMQIMILRWWQKCGHKPIVLMGGGTTKIGDPSGRDSSRPVLSNETIDANINGIQKVFGNFLEFGSAASDAVMLNNAEWLDKLSFYGFMSNVGRHFSVNYILAKDSVKQRLEREQHMNFVEFNYMLFQAYDFTELYRTHGCRVQIGGSDQWGNIVAGVDLHRRLEAEKNAGKDNVYEEAFGLTTPLLTTSSGAKMGKTARGAVWLNADMLSPYDYWQYWRNTEDADVGRFLRMFTELSLTEIAKLEALQGAEINEAKKVLATEATALLHGRAEAERAADTARQTFEQGLTGAALPEVELSRAELGAGMPAFKLLVLAGLAATGGDAKRLVQGKGARLNDEVIASLEQLATEADFKNGTAKLAAGKKHHALVKLV